MKLSFSATVIGLVVAVAPLTAAPTPYDFTGHWAGTAMQQGASAPVVADLTGTGTFTGTLGVEFGTLITCTIDGKQNKRVVMTLTCSDGSAGRIKARLDATSRTLAGKYSSHRPGHHGHHGTFTLTSPGTCVPTGQDCTDPATGGGEASVCCNGDCQRAVNPDGSESHSCN